MARRSEAVCLSVDPGDDAARKRACALVSDEEARDELYCRALEVALIHLYDDDKVDAFVVASEAAEAVYGSDVANNLSYGEIGPRATVAAFRSASRHFEKKVRSACDVGSGRGQTAIMASFLGVESVVGIEIVQGLHEMATRAAKKLLDDYGKTVKLRRGDALDLFEPVDVVVCNWICFDAELIKDLTTLFEEKQAAGSIVVTFTTAIQSTRFVVVEKIKLDDMPWKGPCTLYVHSKLSDDQHLARLKSGDPTRFDADQAIAIRREGEPYEESDTMNSLEVGFSSSDEE